MTAAVPRLLMTADAVGGIWTYAVDLAAALADLGWRVEIAVLGPPPDARKHAAATRAGLVVTMLDALPEWLARGPDAVLAGAGRLAALARERDADLLHLNHPALGAGLPAGIPVLAACHSCVATWWEAVRGTPLPEAFAWQADLVGLGYRAAGRLVAPTRAFAEATRRRYGLSAPPAVVANARAAPCLVADRPAPVEAAVTVGRLWDEGKGVALLDRVAALTALPFAAAGPTDGPNGATIALAHLAALGPLPETAIRARLADRPIYVSAALYEPFGLSVLEAAQAGCALVLGDIPTFRELWTDAALLVEPGDAGGFAAAIGRLQADPALRAGLGAAAAARATAHDPATQARAMAGHYAALLDGRARPGEAA